MRELEAELARLGEECRELQGEREEREQDRLDRERTEAETVITEEKRISSSSSLEVTRMKRKEIILTERLVQQEQQEQKLQEDLVSRELVPTSLKEVQAYERRLRDHEQELAMLRQEVQER